MPLKKKLLSLLNKNYIKFETKNIIEEIKIFEQKEH